MLLRMYRRWAETRGFEFELEEVTAGRRPASRRPPSSSRAATPTACSAREKGTHRLVRISPVQLAGQAPDRVRRAVGGPADRGRRQRDRDRRQGPARRRVPLVGRRRPARQRDRLGRAPHPPARPASSCRARTSAASTRTRTRRCRSSRRSWPTSSARSAPTSWTQIAGAKTDIDFGTQIRSYVIHPYQMVKDLRSGHESGNPDGGARRRPRPVHGGVPAVGARRRCPGADGRLIASVPSG